MVIRTLIRTLCPYYCSDFIVIVTMLILLNPSRRCTTRFSLAMHHSSARQSLALVNSSRGAWCSILIFYFFIVSLSRGHTSSLLCLYFFCTWSSLVCHFSGGMVLLPTVSINTLRRMEHKTPTKPIFSDHCRCCPPLCDNAGSADATFCVMRSSDHAGSADAAIQALRPAGPCDLFMIMRLFKPCGLRDHAIYS